MPELLIIKFAVTIWCTGLAKGQQNLALKSLGSWCGAETLENGSRVYCDEVLDGASAVGNNAYKFRRARRDQFMIIELTDFQTVQYVRLMQDYPAQSKNIKKLHIGVHGGASYTMTLPNNTQDGFFWYQIQLEPVSTNFVDIRFDEVFHDVPFTINEVEIYSEEPSFVIHTSFCSSPVAPEHGISPPVSEIGRSAVSVSFTSCPEPPEVETGQCCVCPTSNGQDTYPVSTPGYKEQNCNNKNPESRKRRYFIVKLDWEWLVPLQILQKQEFIE